MKRSLRDVSDPGRLCSSRRGFTLIEVLISSFVLAMMVTMAVMSYSFFLRTWQSRKLSDNSLLYEYRNSILVHYAMESIYDYFVTDHTNERRGRFYPFFRGERDQLHCVTLSSVFRRGLPAIACLRLAKIPGSSLYNLVYEEAPLDTVYLRYNNRLPEYRFSLVLFNEVQKVNIRYYGITEVRWIEKISAYHRIRKWKPTFSGRDINGIPEKIEIIVTIHGSDIHLVYPVRGRNNTKTTYFQRWRLQ